MKIKNASPSFIDYQALKGSFGHVTYFVTKTTLRDVAENLDLAPQSPLTFSERIQRLVNEKRVETEILPYLEKNELRFFNALVCILLPDSDTQDGFWDFEEYLDENGNGLGGLGKLRMTKEVGRIVLDGQHRFKALKAFWEKHKDDPDQSHLSIEVALIFVVVDELGKRNRKGTGSRTKTITAVRNLFAVLNKTARPVDKTTLLLIDDSDVANVLTRKLIEEGHLEELFVKWTGGESLQPRDPYFTTLHVVKDAIRFFLRDYSSELEFDYGSTTERENAVKKFFDETPSTEIPLRDAIPKLITRVAAYPAWLALLKKNSIEIMVQPETTEMTAKQGKPLEQARTQGLAFTVAGQKALFRAIIEVFFSQKRRNDKALDKVCEQANALLKRRFFDRNLDPKCPFEGVLYDSRGRMTRSEERRVGKE